MFYLSAFEEEEGGWFVIDHAVVFFFVFPIQWMSVWLMISALLTRVYVFLSV